MSLLPKAVGAVQHFSNMRLIPTKYQGRLHIIAPGTDDVQGKDRSSTSFWVA
jgi:hypothetical protein